MCGIAGFLEKPDQALSKGQPVEVMNKMLHAIAHRGPDDWGIFHIGEAPKGEGVNYQFEPGKGEGEIVLGHRRLSIIDLSRNGHQPMRSSDKRFTIVFNGEIYNYIELREELKSSFEFKTHTDTEVLMNSYRAWGEDMFAKLDGMYAFALWDRDQQQLLCARDPMNIKPFYYAFHAGAFLFASEPRAILKAMGISGTINRQQISEFLLFGISDHDEGTSYQEISQLRGGHFMTIGSDLSIKRKKQFWHSPKVPAPNGQKNGKLYHKIKESVDRQLRSDVPVGSSLSGGIDSGTLVSLAGEILKEDSHKYHTLTFTSDAFANDESQAAKSISEYSGMPQWHPVKIDRQKLRQNLEKLVHDIGEPFTSLSILAQNLVMKKANELGIKVMLDGQGGDEVYLGYPRVAQRIVGEYLRRGAIGKAIRELKGFQAHASLSPKNALLGNLFFAMPGVASYRNKKRMKQLVKSDLLDAYREEVIADRFANKPLQEVQTDELTKYILPRLLRYADRNSMAYGVESRVPHLSVPLVEYALRLPLDQRVSNGWTKFSVRESMDGLLPSDILWAKVKRGFDIPQEEWIKLLKPDLIQWIREFEPAQELFNIPRLIELIEADRAGEMHVWRVISVILWMKFLKVKY